MRKILKAFFNRPALIVAKELIGTYLVTRTPEGIKRYMITETEAYVGPHDLASHSSKGRTKRTEVMFQEAGAIYVYLIYGMHNMLNIVTGEKDYPAAVLIQGVEGIRGPGNVAKHLNISRLLNGKMLGTASNLWIEQDSVPVKRKIARTSRIGIAYAGPVWANKLYRFVLK
ncbi:MAG: DNA-3-methyladenine glycosylase [Patescibacteria group bacterium]